MQPTHVATRGKLEARAWVRHYCNREASVQSPSPASNAFWSGKVQDISREGMGLLLDHRFNAGTILAVTLEDPTSAHSRTVLVQVVHDTFITAHPGMKWLVGCVFVNEVSETDFQQLLSTLGIHKQKT